MGLLFDKDGVHHAVLRGPGDDPRLPGFRPDDGPPGQDVPADVVGVCPVLHHRLDLHPAAGAVLRVGHVGKLDPECPDLHVAAAGTDPADPGLADGGIGGCPPDLKALLPAQRAVPAACLPPYGSTLPEYGITPLLTENLSGSLSFDGMLFNLSAHPRRASRRGSTPWPVFRLVR